MQTKSKQANFRGCERLLKSLADGSRLRLLQLLHEKPMTPTELGEVTGFSSPLTSHHLALLGNLDILVSVREGRSIRYSLNPEYFNGGVFSRDGVTVSVDAWR